MTLYFITGNKNKFLEAKSILGSVIDVEQLNIELDEIQEIDARKIIEHKLNEALKKNKELKNKELDKNKEFIIEDTSLYIDCLNGLPGPLIKWFLKALGPKGVYELTKNLENQRAVAKNLIGYSDAQGKLHFFEGEITGMIVEPRGETTFGWDPIFVPDGYDLSFAQMSKEEKNKISHRKKALDKLVEFLNK
ncbi:MAG: RdgB/HAM1 family non-canonical purine NTP pyrophosphatase [Candidatus Woesearchaeota archaeon]|jgi:non-canonical purine NTP pyrophosphatase (RdgB/HAM1 family)